MNLKISRLFMAGLICAAAIMLLAPLSSFGQAQAGSRTKEEGISISVSNETLPNVLKKLQQLSRVSFIYDQNLADKAPLITLDVRDGSLKNILDRISRIAKLKYSRVDDTVTFAAVSGTVAENTHKVVSGRVIDEQDNPLGGTTVVVKGTTVGTVANNDGEFSINAPSGAILEFNFFGYQGKEVFVGNRTRIDVTMVPESHSLDEVVVVGYGTQKRASLTGAVSTVKGSDLAVAPIASTSNALTGRVSGLVTVQSSGQPGADAASLSIRGFHTAPLVIVDGIESDFNNINANEIENISVLKDASAAIYGSRAGNGVVLVTTKRGGSSKPVVTFNAAWTFQQVTNMAKPLTAGDYTRLEREKWLQSGNNPNNAPFTEEAIAKYYAGNDPDYPSTDWYDYLMRNNSPQQEYNLSVRGGNETIKYYGFFGYMDQQTMIKRGGGNYDRYNIRGNIDAKILPNLTINVDMSSIIEGRRYPYTAIGYDGGNEASNVWLQLLSTMPYYPTSLPDSDKIPYAGSADNFGGANVSTNRDLSGTNDRFDQNIRTQIGLKYDFLHIPGLALKGNIAYDKTFVKTKRFMKEFQTWEYTYATETYSVRPGLGSPTLNQSSSEAQTITGQAAITYDKVFKDKHSLSVLALFECIDTRNENFAGYGEGFESNLFPYLNFAASHNQMVGGNAFEMGRASFVGRINYGYDDKYLAEATLRYDGSAQFQKGRRWGLFPSASLAWRISEENFVKDNARWLTNLKIRASFSQTGEDRGIRNYPYLGGYAQATNNQGYVIGGVTEKTYVSIGMPNPNLTWETMNLVNAGFDFSMFNSAFYGEFDAFYRLRSGIMGTRNNSVPDTFGETLPVVNLNKMDTRGFEFMAGYRNRAGDFNYDISANISWSRSKWVYFDEQHYTDPDDIRLKQLTGQWVDRTIGYQTDGLFSSFEQIEELPYSYSEVAGGNAALNKGDIIIVNRNGDDTINWRDMVDLGCGPTPNWMFGANFNFSWKGISLSMLWQGAFGFYKNVSGIADRYQITFDNRWTEEKNDPRSLIPRLGSKATMYFGSSDYFLRPSDYLRLKNLSLGYSLPKRWLAPLRVQELRVYFSATNLFTLSGLNKYDIDPEAPSSFPTLYYPQMRTLSFGVSISL